MGAVPQFPGRVPGPSGLLGGRGQPLPSALRVPSHLHPRPHPGAGEGEGEGEGGGPGEATAAEPAALPGGHAGRAVAGGTGGVGRELRGRHQRDGGELHPVQHRQVGLWAVVVVVVVDAVWC